MECNISTFLILKKLVLLNYFEFGDFGHWWYYTSLLIIRFKVHLIDWISAGHIYFLSYLYKRPVFVKIYIQGQELGRRLCTLYTVHCVQHCYYLYSRHSYYIVGIV